MARRISAAKRDYARPLEQRAPTKTTASPGKPPIEHGAPAKFTYLLAPWQAERRGDGWYVRAHAGDVQKATWSGPFLDIENACLSIARGLCHELADRHTRHVEQYRLTPKDGRYGLKATTRLKAKTVA